MNLEELKELQIQACLEKIALGHSKQALLAMGFSAGCIQEAKKRYKQGTQE